MTSQMPAANNGDHAVGEEVRGLILGLIGMVVFGLTLPMIRLAVAEFDPVVVGLGRAILAGAVALPILLVTRQPWPSRGDVPLLAMTALGVVIGFPALATIAMVHAPSAHGGVMLAVLPLATAVAAAVFAGERPSAGFWACAIAGAAVVLSFAWLEGRAAAVPNGSSAASPQGGPAWLGIPDLLLIGAVLSAATGYATGARLSRKLGGWQVICWALVLSQPVLVPMVWYFSGPFNWYASGTAWAGFLYVALGSQLFGFFAWNTGLALGGVAKVGQLQLLQTFVTLTGAALVAGEQVTGTQIAFSILVVGIVALGRRTKVVRQPT